MPAFFFLAIVAAPVVLPECSLSALERAAVKQCPRTVPLIAVRMTAVWPTATWSPWTCSSLRPGGLMRDRRSHRERVPVGLPARNCLGRAQGKGRMLFLRKLCQRHSWDVV